MKKFQRESSINIFDKEENIFDKEKNMRKNKCIHLKNGRKN